MEIFTTTELLENAQNDTVVATIAALVQIAEVLNEISGKMKS